MNNKTYIYRENNYDLMRIICSICVVMIHVNAGWYFRDDHNIYATNYRLESFLNIFTRFSVPGFIMLSGAFNLANSNNSDACCFYKKAARKILPPLVLVNIFWIIQMILNGENTIKSIFVSVIKADYGNLWFMPMLICLYLITPLIVKSIKLFTQNELLVFISILGIFACVSQYSTTHFLPYDNGNIASYLFYYLAGYYIYDNSLKKHIKNSYRSILYCVIILALAWIGVFVREKFEITMFDINPFIAFFSPIVITISILTMIMFKDLKVRFNLAGLASLTYCVYLFHTPIIFFYKKMIMNKIAMPEIIHILFEWGVVTILSFFFSWIYRNVERRIIKR